MERGARGPDWGQRIEGLTSDGEGECVFVWQFHQMVKCTAPFHCLLTDSCGGVQNSFANMWLGKQRAKSCPVNVAHDGWLRSFSVWTPGEGGVWRLACALSVTDADWSRSCTDLIGLRVSCRIQVRRPLCCPVGVYTDVSESVFMSVQGEVCVMLCVFTL